jgi:multidrug efflux pump subunit AcrB
VTTSQFFVYRRPIAWTALVATLAWGAFAYTRMPQRQDPVIPVRSGVVLTLYPGAAAETVEQEVTRKVERKVAENPTVETLTSISREGLSVVFVELDDRTKDADAVWQDLRSKLREITDLPVVGDTPLQPQLDEDFGDTVAVMLTIAAPPVPAFEIDQRAAGIRRTLEAHRASRPENARAGRYSGILIHPATVEARYVKWLGDSALASLDEAGLARDGTVVMAPGAGCIDVQLAPGKTEADLRAGLREWERKVVGGGMSHPDLWPGVLVGDLATLPHALRAVAWDPLRTQGRYTDRDLHRFADLIQDRLKQSRNVGKVEQVGVQDEAIHLYYSDRRLAAFGLQPMDVARRLAERNTRLPGGRVELPSRDVVVRPGGAFRSPDEIGGVVVGQREGYPLYLRDLVEVVRGYEDPPDLANLRTTRHARAPGAGDPEGPALRTTKALTLAVRQVEGVRIADFSRDVDAAVASLDGVLPSDLIVDRTSDEPGAVRAKIDQFGGNLVEAIVIIIAVALLFMEWRSALLMAVSIPITIAMTLAICQLLGVDLQQVSIAALIIALGLLVDDPVVAGDAINRELADGKPRDVAAWHGPQKLARAILYATLTNCVAFLPLLLVTGETGEFIYTLPVVVAVSLVSSRVVSMTFIPLLGYYILRGQKGYDAGLQGDGPGSRFARVYNGVSEWCLDHKALTLGFCGALLLAGLATLPFMKTAFFPKDRHTVVTVNVRLAEGVPLRQTAAEARRVIAQVLDLCDADVASCTTFVGAGGPRFWLSVVPEQRADNYAQVLVHTADAAATARVVRTLKRELPPRVAAARVTVEELETGPPVGMPIQVRLTGADGPTLRRLAEAVKGRLRAIPGADNIHDDWDPEVYQVSLALRPDRAELMGITREDLAGMVNTGLSGYTATHLAEADREIPITLRLRADERAGLDDLSTIHAYSGTGAARVPLAQVATVEPKMVPPKVLRRNHERCLTVKCDTVPGVLPSTVVGTLQAQLAADARGWPPGYRVEFGGEREEQAKGFQSVAVALVVSLLAIYLALVLQFNSVTVPLVVFAAVPFGLLGGLMGLLLFGAPFGFMAFLGVASLAGVIVSHIIVLFDYIEEMREKGEPLHRAVIDAALVRLRPVLVTVLATVGGLIPLAIKGGPLWEPMCYVQIVGLLGATLVTKILVPVLYVLFVEDLGLIAWEPAGHEAPGPSPASPTPATPLPAAP